ncbi:MAG: hypothetical protein RLZZ419_110 [Pseudomonadota bacterium]|jgi:hypothetical protein
MFFDSLFLNLMAVTSCMDTIVRSEFFDFVQKNEYFHSFVSENKRFRLILRGH